MGWVSDVQQSSGNKTRNAVNTVFVNRPAAWSTVFHAWVRESYLAEDGQVRVAVSKTPFRIASYHVMMSRWARSWGKIWYSRSYSMHHRATHLDEQAKPWMKHLHITGFVLLFFDVAFTFHRVTLWTYIGPFPSFQWQDRELKCNVGESVISRCKAWPRFVLHVYNGVQGKKQNWQ